MKTSHPRTSPRLLLIVLFLVVTGALWSLPSGPARADTTIESLEVNGVLDAEGMLRVTETYTYPGSLGDSFTKQFATRENGMNDLQYVQEISEVTATVGGEPAEVEVARAEERTTVTVRTAGRSGPLVLDYRVRGAVRVSGDDHVLTYRALQGLTMPVQEVRAIIQTPVLGQAISCYAGPPNSTAACRLAAQGREDYPFPTWEDGPRGAGEQVTAVVVFQPGQVAASAIVEYRWTLGRAFSAGPIELIAALGALLIGAALIFTLHRRAGADAGRAGKPEVVGEFVAAGEGITEFKHHGTIRPGHVGTVSDERVDPIDVTATILDLAVRGHLRITELAREREFAPVDWTLTRRDDAPEGDELLPFESDLLDIVAPAGEESRVSTLTHAVQAQVGSIQDDLYDEVVQRGWYERRPDQVRNKWMSLALGALVIAVVITGVLVALTTFGLLGLALIAFALGGVFVAQEMPARTASGAALLHGLGRLSSELHHHPTDEMPPGRELHELSEVLPYAVVLGGVERWLDALAAADTDPDPDSTDLDWYHGPENWHLRDLPDSLRNFITTVSGQMFSR